MFRNRVCQKLYEEHAAVQALLQRLEQAVAKQRDDVPDAKDPLLAKLMTDVASELPGEVDRHFSFEENRLFPLLAERGHNGIVAMLTEEHEIIRPLARELAQEAATALAGAGFLPQSWQEFHDRASELCERETFHIQKEEMGLIGALRFLLDADTDTRLAELYVAEAG